MQRLWMQINKQLVFMAGEKLSSHTKICIRFNILSGMRVWPKQNRIVKLINLFGEMFKTNQCWLQQKYNIQWILWRLIVKPMVLLNINRFTRQIILEIVLTAITSLLTIPSILLLQQTPYYIFLCLAELRGIMVQVQ